MRVLHFSNSLYPSVTGGTEIFVDQLVKAQQQQAPLDEFVWAAHEESILPVGGVSPGSLGRHQRLLPPIKAGKRIQKVAATAVEIDGFGELLEQYRPHWVHLHSFSDRCGLTHARAAKASGAKLFVTVHAPGFSCVKGNLIDDKGEVCDGVLREARCTACRLQNGGLGRGLAYAVSMQRGWPFSTESEGRIRHVLTARLLTAAFHRAWLELAHLADAIHVLAGWSRDVLLRQGIPSDKVHLIRTAGPQPLPFRRRSPMQDGVLRLVYWGRCHPVKGIHLLVEAIQDLSTEAPIQLDCYGPGWEDAYGQQLLVRIGRDTRIRVLGNLTQKQLLPRLQGYDIALVPSTWLETGPLTVLEAFSAGLPVAGSNLGGIRELLEGVAGCELLPPDGNAWSEFLANTLKNPASLKKFDPPKDRLFSDVSRELNFVYQGLL